MLELCRGFSTLVLFINPRHPRLSDKSDSNSRGFGGVGVIWHKSLDVVPISNISSERICGIRIKTVGGGEESWLTVLGVYLPCLDLGIGLYSETLIELERAVTESCNMGSVVITGDFNAHLGNLWGPRAASNPNIQGILLGEAVNRCSLHAASLSEHASGPCYTYHSGNKSTTVDYIFTDIEASSCIEKCWTHDEVDLNTSDHLPISALLRLTCSGKSQSESSHDWIRIDWSKAQKCGDIPTFQATLEERLKPFTNLTRSDVTQLDDEINQVAYIIKCTAEELLPRFKPKKFKRSFADKVLTQICAKSKSTWKDWDKAGRPSSGPLYDSKCSLRADVRKRVKLCVAMNERKQVQRREHFFKTNAHHRFKLPQKRKKSRSSHLRVNGTLVSEPAHLQAWTAHFQKLAQTQETQESSPLSNLRRHITTLHSESFQNMETFLDVPFTEDEVSHHLQRKMKLKKSAGQ